MKVYVKTMDGVGIAKNYVEQDLGIEIEHNGNTYTIMEDNHDRLILRSVDKIELIINPQSSNAIEIDSI